MKKTVTLLLCMAMLLSGYAGTARSEEASPAGDVWETIEKANIYAFPLVLMDGLVKALSKPSRGFSLIRVLPLMA